MNALPTDGWPPVTEVPPVMTAVTFREFGPPEVLRTEELPTPVPAADEVLVRVAAVSVGRLLDIAARAGTHPWAQFKFPHVLGAEHAGVVAQVGAGVTGLAVGHGVAVYPVITGDVGPGLIGTHRPGAYAQYVVVPARNAKIVPAGMSAPAAAAVALSGAVAMEQFDLTGGVGPGSRVIVPGATSALGSTAALLARHLGAEVVVTSRHPDKRTRLTELGFAHALDTDDDDYLAQVMAAFSGRKATLVVDNLGSDRVWQRNVEALDVGGAVVLSGAFLDGVVSLDLRRLYTRSHRIIGVRSGTLDSFGRLWDEVHRGFRPVVDRCFPLASAAEAHRYVEQAQNVGRVVLTPT
jgi:NADPH:quinone reductase-like Zn-dependent oxidoreductase